MSELLKISFDGKPAKLWCHGGDDYMTQQIRKSNTFFESKVLHILLDQQIINQDSVVVDVGAYTGNHTVFFAQRCRKVYAFEPLPESSVLLNENILCNQLQNVLAYRMGIGAERRSISTRARAVDGNLGATFWWYYGEPLPSDNYEKLDAVSHYSVALVDSLDNLIQEKIDFVKIDVEGMEFEVLKGLQLIAQTYHPAILVEVWGEDNRKAVMEWLDKFGYKVVNSGHKTHILAVHESE